MAIINAQLNGNASSTSVWDTGTIPADGDQVYNTGGYNITFDQDITLGTSAASAGYPGTGTTATSAAIFHRGSGTITIAAGVTVRAKGDVLIQQGKLVMEAGSTLILDTTSNPEGALGFYILDIAANYGDDISQVKLVTNGTEANPVTIKKEGAGFALIESGISLSNSGTNKRGSGVQNCSYTIFKDLGVVPTDFTLSAWNAANIRTVLTRSYYRIHPAIKIDTRTDTQNTVYTAQVEHVWNNCVFDGCTGIASEYAAGAAATFKKIELNGCTIKNTRYHLREYSFIRSTASSKTWSDPVDTDDGTTDAVTYNHPVVTGTRKITNCVFDCEVVLSDGGSSWDIEGNVFADGIYILQTGTWKKAANTFKNNFVVRSDQWTIPSAWAYNASPQLWSHYGVKPKEDHAGYKRDYMTLPYGTGKRDPEIPAAISSLIGTWVTGNYFLEDSARQNPHYVNPNKGDGNGIHVFKDNIFEGVRVSGDGEFLRLAYQFSVPRNTPTQDTAAAIIIGNLTLPTSNFTTGGSFNHIIDTTYPSGHPRAGEDVLGSDFTATADYTGSVYYGGYLPHVYTNNTCFLGAGEGALNISEAGYHYDVIRYCKNNLFWDSTKKTGVGVPWAIGDVSNRSHPDFVQPENVDYNIKINAPGSADLTLTGNTTENSTPGTGHNTTKNHLNFNNNGYTGLELQDNTSLLGGVRRLNAFGNNDVELVVSNTSQLPFVNYQTNSGFFAFSKTGSQSSTETWERISKQHDYTDPERSTEWTFSALKTYIRSSMAPIRSNQSVTSVLNNYETFKDPNVGTNGLGTTGYHSYNTSHDVVQVLANLQSGYTHPGALPFQDPNSPPVAGDDAFSVNMNNNLVITYDQLLANDTDLDDTTLFIGSITQPSNGTVTVDSVARTVTYSPTTNYFGSDSFTYAVTDSKAASDVGTVVITVVNQPPVAAGHTLTGESNTSQIITKASLMVGASDPEGTAVTFYGFTQAENGAVVESGTDLIYTPNSNFAGIDTFTYTVQDADGVTADATVTILVQPGAGVVSSLTTEEQNLLRAAGSGMTLSQFLALK